MKRKPVDLNGIINSTVAVGGEHDDHYASTTTVLNGTVWIIVDCHSRVLVLETDKLIGLCHTKVDKKGSDYDSIGRVVTYASRGLRFESSHWRNSIMIMLHVNC